MVTDRRKLFLRDIPFDHIRGGSADHRNLIFPDKADTLLRGIRPLVKLSRKILHRKAVVLFLHRERLFIEDIHRRFCEYTPARLLKRLIRKILHVIPDQDPYSAYTADTEVMADLMP